MVFCRTVGPAFGHRARAVRQERHRFGILVHQFEDLSDVALQLRLEGFRRDDGGMAFRPETPMAGFEEIQRQLLFAGEVLVPGRIGVAALLGDVANAGAVEPALAEQLCRGAQDFPLGRWIRLA